MRARHVLVTQNVSKVQEIVMPHFPLTRKKGLITLKTCSPISCHIKGATGLGCINNLILFLNLLVCTVHEVSSHWLTIAEKLISWTVLVIRYIQKLVSLFPVKVELNFLLSFLSTCYLSSTSFYLSSTPFCVPAFIQLCLKRERVALQLRAPPIDE